MRNPVASGSPSPGVTAVPEPGHPGAGVSPYTLDAGCLIDYLGIYPAINQPLAVNLLGSARAASLGPPD